MHPEIHVATLPWYQPLEAHTTASIHDYPIIHIPGVYIASRTSCTLLYTPCIVSGSCKIWNMLVVVKVDDVLALLPVCSRLHLELGVQRNSVAMDYAPRETFSHTKSFRFQLTPLSPEDFWLLACCRLDDWTETRWFFRKFLASVFCCVLLRFFGSDCTCGRLEFIG